MHRSRTSRTPGSPPWRARAASACWTTPSCSPGVLGALGSCMQGSSAMFGEASDVCMRPCRSLKKEEKLRQKKSAAWKERQGLQRKDQAAKQKKCGRACCCQRFRVPHCRLTPAPVCCRRADNLKADTFHVVEASRDSGPLWRDDIGQRLSHVLARDGEEAAIRVAEVQYH